MYQKRTPANPPILTHTHIYVPFECPKKCTRCLIHRHWQRHNCEKTHAHTWIWQTCSHDIMHAHTILRIWANIILIYARAYQIQYTNMKINILYVHTQYYRSGRMWYRYVRAHLKIGHTLFDISALVASPRTCTYIYIIYNPRSCTYIYIIYYRSLLQNMVSFIGLFCQRDL